MSGSHIKQKPHETGAQFVVRINGAARDLEVMGENISDAQKLSRLMSTTKPHSTYDNLSLQYYSTPEMTWSKAAGLFEGLDKSGLVEAKPKVLMAGAPIEWISKLQPNTLLASMLFRGDLDLCIAFVHRSHV